eukprot:CAMPEP_0197240922 /NCGR_PEP_ID=MMETSP1429-20130617/7100_1 /TAXON_ID=49237 /ORGANISM="Chaetoceros  sp., Strain UNC1202" /LENGTH=428 /DNA_ID=CAMNT_0042700665 /DNA_START=86 /DNA_END=1372 /DNA_ORIENTATION=+
MGMTLGILVSSWCCMILSINSPALDYGTLPLISNHRLFTSVEKNEADPDTYHAAQVWSGEAPRRTNVDISAKTIEVVVAYCAADIQWMYDDLLGKLPNQVDATVKMTIVSKCGNEAELPKFIEDHRVKQVDILTLPNVGGCDYAYAHFINRYVAKTTPEDAASSMLLFIKDTPRNQEYFQFALHERFRGVDELIQMASRGEFVCGTKTHCSMSSYHDNKVLNTFVMGEYKRQSERAKITGDDDFSEFNALQYENLEDFHKRALNWTFPNEIFTEVCYGGSFALPGSLLLSSLSKDLRTQNAIKALEESLSRDTGTSVEEHFAERTWAGMLANPVDSDEINALRRLKGATFGGALQLEGSLVGPLLSKWKLCDRYPSLHEDYNSASCHGLPGCSQAFDTLDLIKRGIPLYEEGFSKGYWLGVEENEEEE